MAKSKADLHAEAVAAGQVAEDTDPEDFSVAQLEGITGDKPIPVDTSMHMTPQVAPDGHVNLTQEDIDSRA